MGDHYSQLPNFKWHQILGSALTSDISEQKSVPNDQGFDYELFWAADDAVSWDLLKKWVLVLLE